MLLPIAPMQRSLACASLKSRTLLRRATRGSRVSKNKSVDPGAVKNCRGAVMKVDEWAGWCGVACDSLALHAREFARAPVRVDDHVTALARSLDRSGAPADVAALATILSIACHCLPYATRPLSASVLRSFRSVYNVRMAPTRGGYARGYSTNNGSVSLSTGRVGASSGSALGSSGKSRSAASSPRSSVTS